MTCMVGEIPTQQPGNPAHGYINVYIYIHTYGVVLTIHEHLVVSARLWI